MPIAHETRVSPLTQIVRRRLLPVPGEVLVHVGDRVRPSDVVAQASVPGQLQVIDVPEALEVSVRGAGRHIRVAVGQHVEADAVLASVRRLDRRKSQVVANYAGLVQGVQDGMIILREEPQLLRLKAYVPGEVVERYPHRGVAIRTLGALIRGIWGSGEEREGLLIVPTQGPAEPLTWEMVSLRYRGAILVGGVLEDPKVIYRARQFRLSGLIVGSIRPGLRPLCESLALPIVITEGIGRLPMAEAIFRLLLAYNGRPATISGGTANRDAPELIIPLKPRGGTTAVAVARPMSTGMHVRLTRAPYLGLIGEISALSIIPQETPIGTQAEGAEVRLPDGRKVFVPYVNMERLD